MVNALQNIQHVTFFARWLAAVSRLKPWLVKPPVARSAMGVAVVLSCLSYVWQANSSAAANVEIRELRQQAAELATYHQQLERQVAQLRSLSRVSEASSRLGLVALPKQEFVSEGADGSVALR